MSQNSDKTQKKQKILTEKVAKLNSDLENRLLSDSLQLNMTAIDQLFLDDDTFIKRSFLNKHDSSLQFKLIHCDGLISAEVINESIIKPLVLSEISKSENLPDILLNNAVFTNQAKKTTKFKEIIEAVTYGDSVLFMEGCNEALILDTKKFTTRAIAEPDGEKILKGPKEGFTESIMINLSLIHRKLRTNELKLKFISVGRKTKTDTCVCYVDSIVNKKILKELLYRLNKIDIDGVLDSNYITELIRDSKLSPFRTIGTTERPDSVAAKILEGRIALIVDGSPVVLTLPYLFIENFQSPEDYYVNYIYASFSRMLRIFAFFLSLSVPALYVAIVAYHHEMLPTNLLINITLERQSVPLPAALEAFVMLIVFDILKETGIRMPANIGQALSIVGALVIGQAAVEAKLIAAPMIIIVATTGITGLLVPRLSPAIISLRYFLLALASVMGFYGLMTGFSIILIHILTMRSFGISQLSPLSSINFLDIKDTVIRAPWTAMKTRPKSISKNRIRLAQKQAGETND